MAGQVGVGPTYSCLTGRPIAVMVLSNKFGTRGWNRTKPPFAYQTNLRDQLSSLVYGWQGWTCTNCLTLIRRLHFLLVLPANILESSGIEPLLLECKSNVPPSTLRPHKFWGERVVTIHRLPVHSRTHYLCATISKCAWCWFRANLPDSSDRSNH